MALRQITKQHRAVRDDIADLMTSRALPTHSLAHLDPFLFLNHHGPQHYPPHNGGLPFGPHPHRGFETVTFILKGELAHHDTAGHSSVITAGGVQWMTAGRGIVHSEVSSPEFLANGGDLEILQLWVNLPSHMKLAKPRYVGLQSEAIPRVLLASGVEAQLLSGEAEGTRGAFHPLFPLELMTLRLSAGSSVTLSAPEKDNVLFYVVSGELTVNGELVSACRLVEFAHVGAEMRVTAQEPCVAVYGHAQPFNEPIVAEGPFVMNSRQEIIDAIADYQQGRFI